MMKRKLENLKGSGDAAASPTAHFRNHGMLVVESAKGLLSDVSRIPVKDLFDHHGGQKIVLGVAKCDLLAEAYRGLVVNGQENWNGKEMAVGETHFVEDATKVGCPHEAVQWRKSASGKELEVAHG